MLNIIKFLKENKYYKIFKLDCKNIIKNIIWYKNDIINETHIYYVP